MPIVLIILSAFLLLPTVASARIISVPDDQQTIQGGIDAAENGDTVLVAPGRYRERINFNRKLITVASNYLVTGDHSLILRTIIDGNEGGRTVSIVGGENENAKLIGFMITGGVTNYGGGIYVRSSSPYLARLVITNNEASNNGGGFYATAESSPTVEFCTISGNRAASSGGGVWTFDNSTVDIRNSIIYFNSPDAVQEGRLSVNYTDIAGGYDGEGNINEDPRFVNRNNFDFNLTLQSPCINRGDPDAPEDRDGTRADMGALAFIHIPIINVNPVRVNFGPVTLEHSRSVAIHIANIGHSDLALEAPVIEPEDVPFAIIEGGEPARLQPDEETGVEVMFEPFQIGEFNAVLRLVSNDPNRGVLDIELTGAGVPPLPEMVVDREAIDFGVVPLRSLSEAGVRISNTGEAALNIVNAGIENDTSGGFETVFERQVTINPGEDYILPVRFFPTLMDEFTGVLIIESNDPARPLVTIALSGFGGAPVAHFEYTSNTGVNHSVLVLSAVIGDNSLPIGSEIGVFSPNGLCCGAEPWLADRVGLTVWGDNDMTDALDGMREGEAMYFRLYDIVEDAEITARAEYIDGDQQYVNNGWSVIRLTGVIDDEPDEPRIGFTLRLEQNWNMISAPVVPEETDVRALWQPVVMRGSLLLLKSASGQFYAPIAGFSNLPPWDYRYGYQVKMARSDTLFIAGEFAPEDRAIPLRNGWSIVAYLPERNVEAVEAFSNVVELLAIAKDGGGRFYAPRVGFSNMLPLQRGQGYQVKVTEEVDLVWNVPQRVAGRDDGRQSYPAHFTTVANSSANMSLVITGIEQGGLPSAGSWETGVFTLEGLCVGAVVMEGSAPWGTAVWGDDPTTPEIDGAREGEVLTLKVWDGLTEMEVGGNWLMGNGRYETDGLAMVELSMGSAVPAGLELLAPQPNPFNSATVIRFNLPEARAVRLALFDTTGREVLRLADGRFNGGRHAVTLAADDLPGGVYIVRLMAAEETRSAKVVLVK